MDLEWRPSFGVGGRPQASLMQVAVEGRVFLLDLPQLLSPARGQEPQAFSQLVSRLLADPSITKLGECSPGPVPQPCLPACGRGGCPGEARAPSLGAHHSDSPACRLRDGRGPAEPGRLLPCPGPGAEAASGQPGPAAGAQAGQRWGLPGRGSHHSWRGVCAPGLAHGLSVLSELALALLPGHRSPGPQSTGSPGFSRALGSPQRHSQHTLNLGG